MRTSLVYDVMTGCLLCLHTLQDNQAEPRQLHVTTINQRLSYLVRVLHLNFYAWVARLFEVGALVCVSVYFILNGNQEEHQNPCWVQTSSKKRTDPS